MITMLISITSQTPAVFVSLLFGAWTDKNGRRLALILPVIGSIIHCVIQLFVMYFNLSLYILVLSTFINVCSGSFSLAFQTSLAYISDVTTQKDRIFRLGKSLNHEIKRFKDKVIVEITTYSVYIST